MENNDLADIFITHLVNPYGFWGVNLSESVDYEEGLVIRLSRFLQADYKKFIEKSEEHRYEIGQLVAVYCKSYKVWARGIIDDMYGANAMLVWLMDFGFHASKITLPEMIMPLSDEALAFSPIVIQKYGLYGILPVNLVADLLFTCFEAKPAKFWLPGALKIVEDHLNISVNTKFLKKYEHIHVDGSKQIFGNLLLNIDGKLVDLSDILIERKAAMYDEKQFLEGLPAMKIILRTDRLVPMSIKDIPIGNTRGRELTSSSQNNESHFEFVLNWTKNAAKASNKNLLEPVEDDIY